MRIYRGSDADLVLRPFMVRLSEIASFDLQLWTSGSYVAKRSTIESGMTIDSENNIINVHLTDKETGYLDAGVLNAKMMYRITDSEYPDGVYDGIITIPQEYYLMTPPSFTGETIEEVYESGYTEGYNYAIENSVLSINGEKGNLNLKTVNGNGLLGEGNIEIQGGGGGDANIIILDNLTQEERKAIYEKLDLSKPIDTIFLYNSMASLYTMVFIDEVYIYFFATDTNSKGEFKAMALYSNGEFNSTNFHLPSLLNLGLFDVSEHIEQCSDFLFESHGGDWYSIFNNPSATYPNAFFIDFLNGYGDIQERFSTPVSVLWNNGDKYIRFFADNAFYTYKLNFNGRDYEFLFVSQTKIGGGSAGDIPTKVSELQNDSKYINLSSQSSTYSIQHIWTGSQTQYDALETKDAKTLFIII